MASAPSEADHKMEYGLLGVAASPDFATTGHVYLQYFPSFNPASSPPGLRHRAPDLEDVRPRISRFTIDLNTKRLDLELRAGRLRVRRPDLLLLPRRRRHGLRPEGNLYVTTGDTNSSQNQPAPTAWTPVRSATAATTRSPSARRARRPRPRARTAVQRLLLPGRTPHRG